MAVYEFESREDATAYARAHNSRELRAKGYVYAIRKGRKLPTFSGKTNVQTWQVEKIKR